MRDRRFAARTYLLTWSVLLILPAVAVAAPPDPYAPDSPEVVACLEHQYIASKAESLGICTGGFSDPARLAQIYEEKLNLPAPAALALARAMRDSDGAYRRGRKGRPPAIEELRQIEAQFILLLDIGPEKAVLVDEVCDFYAYWSRELGSPAPGLLDRVAQARDPIALASRLTRLSTQQGDNPFYTEVLLAALTVRPDSPGLWQQAARFSRSPGFKAVFFEQAYRVYLRSLGPRADALGPVEQSVALALAGQWLKQELDTGLAAEAVATFHALPPAVREPLAAGWQSGALAELPGMPIELSQVDLRLPLAAACLLAGDRKTAAELLDGTAAWPGDGDRRADILAQSLRRYPEDPFPLFGSTLAARHFLDLPGVLALAFARFAERERYPSVAAYFLRQVTGRLAAVQAPWQPGPTVLTARIPDLVQLTVEARRLEGEVEELYRTAAGEIRTQTGVGTADLPAPLHRARSPEEAAMAGAMTAVLANLAAERKVKGPCLVADLAPFAGLAPDPRRIVLTAEEARTAWRWFGLCELTMPLFFLDRSGRRGFALWDDSFQGGTILLEKKGDGWVATGDLIWIT